MRALLASRYVHALTTPHSVDHYLDRVHPMLSVHQVRAVVEEVRPETDAASTVVMRPNDTWRGARAGQHVQFGVEVDGTRRIRCFSVVDSESDTRDRITVSVKVHPEGYVSQHLKEGLRPGTIVHLSQAEGDFVLDDHVPDHLTLISGGSGITPVMAMLRTLRDRGHDRPVTFVHYARSRADEMFSDELDAIARDCTWARVERIYTRDPDPTAAVEGRFTPDHLDAFAIDAARHPTYVCGPAGLIDVVGETYDKLGGDLRREWFKVPTVDLDAEDATGTVTFEASGRATDNDGRTLLEQAEGSGLAPEFGCRMGICNTCSTRKVHGAVRNVITGEVRADTDEKIKICVNAPVGDVCLDL
ncbi:UNVERIFIED_CONTAM: hypothetical protein LK11_39180 [Mumia flava]